MQQLKKRRKCPLRAAPGSFLAPVQWAWSVPSVLWKKVSSKINNDHLITSWTLRRNKLSSLPFWHFIQELCHLSNSFLARGSQSYLWPRKQPEQVYVLREACSWEIIWRIWNQSIPLDKQSQTKIDLAHRNILFGPQCIFKNLSQYWNIVRFQM